MALIRGTVTVEQCEKELNDVNTKMVTFSRVRGEYYTNNDKTVHTVEDVLFDKLKTLSSVDDLYFFDYQFGCSLHKSQHQGIIKLAHVIKELTSLGILNLGTLSLGVWCGCCKDDRKQAVCLLG